MQNDVNLTSPPLSVTCNDAANSINSHFANAPFSIEDFIPKDARTCPQPGVFAPNGLPPSAANLPGGCTRDIVHRFYQEQYQLNDGEQDRYTTGSDAVGLTQSYYNTRELPIYEYLHSGGHPKYAIADDFFQAAFGGSFLNHQWLIAAASPTWPGAGSHHSVVDANGMPNNYTLYHATGPVTDGRVTVACPPPPTVPNLACGDFAVNTTQPAFQPHGSAPYLPPQTGTTIGDELNAAGVSWAWYSGGWSNADGDAGAPGWTNGTGPSCSDPDSFANPTFPVLPEQGVPVPPSTVQLLRGLRPGHAHGAREPAGAPEGRAGVHRSRELVGVGVQAGFGQLHQTGRARERASRLHERDPRQRPPRRPAAGGHRGSCGKDTMVIVTYDEFGGEWDHVSPPGQGGTAGPHDEWGPGTRIPTLVVSPFLRGNFALDHTQYDTTSILKTIEERYGLAPLSSRDAAVNSMSNVFDAKQYEAAK